jgi:hypothetical protein
MTIFSPTLRRPILEKVLSVTVSLIDESRSIGKVIAGVITELRCWLSSAPKKFRR